MTKVVICGISGRMGSHIADMVRTTQGLQLSGATEAPDSYAIGTTLPEGPMVVDDLSKCIERADVVIDFTSPASTLKQASIVAENQKAIVVGTTGFNDQEKSQLTQILKNIPSVWAPNMSIGVNVLLNLVAEAARLLGNDYDVEILEAHHRHKQDAPSGTAFALAESAARALDRNLMKVANYHREGKMGERPEKEIGIQTLRGGDIVGDHTVMFAGVGERLELTHRATNRDNFARGAVQAALWVVDKEPGLYTMRDVLNLKD